MEMWLIQICQKLIFQTVRSMIFTFRIVFIFCKYFLPSLKRQISVSSCLRRLVKLPFMLYDILFMFADCIISIAICNTMTNFIFNEHVLQNAKYFPGLMRKSIQTPTITIGIFKQHLWVLFALKIIKVYQFISTRIGSWSFFFVPSLNSNLRSNRFRRKLWF